jgi:hypothetical protein
MSEPERPTIVRVFEIGKICPVGRSLDHGERVALVLRQLDEAHAVRVGAAERRTRVLGGGGRRRLHRRLARRLRQRRGRRHDRRATAFGGSVEAPISGFSISIAPPHFEHFVRALGRSPSLDSSNLNLDWQLGQTTIIATHLRAPCGATLFGPASLRDGRRIIRIRRAAQRDKMESPSVHARTPAAGQPGHCRGGDVERNEILWFDGDDEDIEDEVDDDEDFDEDDDVAGDDVVAEDDSESWDDDDDEEEEDEDDEDVDDDEDDDVDDDEDEDEDDDDEDEDEDEDEDDDEDDDVDEDEDDEDVDDEDDEDDDEDEPEEDEEP